MARAWPMWRVSSQAEPFSPGTPMRAKVALNSADALAKRMSQWSDRMKPQPNAGPLMAAMVGLRQVISVGQPPL
jgi:hypothetical protein